MWLLLRTRIKAKSEKNTTDLWRGRLRRKWTVPGFFFLTLLLLERVTLPSESEFWRIVCWIISLSWFCVNIRGSRCSSILGCDICWCCKIWAHSCSRHFNGQESPAHFQAIQRLIVPLTHLSTREKQAFFGLSATWLWQSKNKSPAEAIQSHLKTCNHDLMLRWLMMTRR